MDKQVFGDAHAESPFETQVTRSPRSAQLEPGGCRDDKVLVGKWVGTERQPLTLFSHFIYLHGQVSFCVEISVTWRTSRIVQSIVLWLVGVDTDTVSAQGYWSFGLFLSASRKSEGFPASTVFIFLTVCRTRRRWSAEYRSDWKSPPSGFSLSHNFGAKCQTSRCCSATHFTTACCVL